MIKILGKNARFIVNYPFQIGSMESFIVVPFVEVCNLFLNSIPFASVLWNLQRLQCASLIPCYKKRKFLDNNQLTA